MRFFTVTSKRVKILGIKVLKIKPKKKYLYFYLLGICIYKKYNRFLDLENNIRENKNFNTLDFDKQIASIIPLHSAVANISLNKKNIAYIATRLLDMGGHSKCLRDLSKSLQMEYNQQLFVIDYDSTINQAPVLMNFLKSYMNVVGTEVNYIKFNEIVYGLAQSIIKFAPKVLFVYIHPDDIFGSAVIAYLKHITNIKIIFFNHASHYPVIGMSFSDIILECSNLTKKITEERRGFYNCKVIGLQSLNKGDTFYFSEEEKKNIKHLMGIHCIDDCYITMSGGSSYKFFDNDHSSEYFNFIKRLLKKEKKLYHVIISEFNSLEKNIIINIFKDDIELLTRLKFIKYQSEFDIYFQCADVFIDSFPISSALTQIDLMRNKVASVVKINVLNDEYSFSEYQMPNYPYMFILLDDMEKAIFYLLYNRKVREEIIKMNYDYWLKTYESTVVKNKYIKLIEDDNICRYL